MKKFKKLINIIKSAFAASYYNKMCSKKILNNSLLMYVLNDKNKKDIINFNFSNKNICNISHLKKFSFNDICQFAVSKTIITDSPLPDFFIKRREQMVIFLFSMSDKKNLYTISRSILSSDLIIINNNDMSYLHSLAVFKLFKGKIFTLSLNNNKPVLNEIPNIFKDSESSNNKKNIIIFCSDLRKNGMTTSMLNLCQILDTNKNNYFFLIRQSLYEKSPKNFDILPVGFSKLFIDDNLNNGTFFQKLCHSLYFRFNISLGLIENTVAMQYLNEYKKRFFIADIDGFVHYTGYASDILMLFSNAKKVCKNITTAVMVHNDMMLEYTEKHNFNLPSLKYAYKHYNYILPVSNSVYDSLFNEKNPLITSNKNNVIILNNPHNHLLVIERSKDKPAVDKDTKMNISFDKLSDLLNSDKKIFVTVGRFSYEKGHERFINAFTKLHSLYPDTAIIIIGGYGDLYDAVVKKLDFLTQKGCAAVIENISNPFPIIKQCSCFVLPSLREPLGLVMLEADSLNLPLVVPDIKGAGDFIKENNGKVFENSEEGLFKGMEAYLKGTLLPINIDYEQYNLKIAELFTSLF